MATSTVNTYIQPNGTAMTEGPRDYPKKLVIRSQNRIFLQAVNEIDYLTAAANYVHIHTKGQVFRIRSTINAIEQRLDPQKFGRIHRCTIVSFDRIKECRPLQRGDFQLTLNDGAQLKMSRRHREQLEKIVTLSCPPATHLVKYEGASSEQGGSAPAAAVRRRGPSLA